MPTSTTPGPHPDPDALAALAMDDRNAGAGRAHLAVCARCTREVDDLRAAATSGSTGAARPVPPHLWARVEGQLRRDGQERNGEPPSPSRRRWWWIAAGLAVVAIMGVAWVGGEGDRALGAVTLAPLEEGGSGTAVLARRDGRAELRVDVRGVDPGDGYLELWLRDADDALVSLGPATPGVAHPLPPGMDPADYPVVEISVEALDGDPAHGGRSVLRGTLPV